MLPIAERHHAYAEQLRDMLEGAGLRVEVDERSEKIGYKIREAQLQKTPYMLVIGDKEMADQNVSVRHRKAGDLGAMSVNDFIDRLHEEVAQKARD